MCKYWIESGNNYIVLYDSDNIYLFSYDTLIATYTKEQRLILTEFYNYSTTTSKHLNKFINKYTCYDSNELKKLIRIGVVKIED